jgi:hypothetical protein
MQTHAILPRMSLAAEASLWTRARASFARAAAALGSAAKIAALGALTHKVRRQILAWIAPLEHVVRKLLLTEAARFAREAQHQRSAGLQTRIVFPHAPSGKSGGARTSGPELDLTSPETWPVHFSLAPPCDPHRVENEKAPRIRALWRSAHLDDAHASRERHPAVRVRHPEDPVRLARRFEALRRVLDDPAPYARRLARLIERLRRRVPQVAQSYALAPARSNDYDRAEPRLCVDAISEALAALPAFPDSG